MRSRRDARGLGLITFAALLMLLPHDSHSPNASTPVIPGTPTASYWSTDNVAAVLENGQLLLESGRIAQRSGTADVRTGQAVTAIQTPDRGLVVHKQAVRRADFPPPVPAVLEEGVEELFLFTDGGTLDVFYRNAKQVTRLHLTPVLVPPALPGFLPGIGWSVDGKAFFVRLWERQTYAYGSAITPYWEIFTLSPLPLHRATATVAKHVKTIHTRIAPTGFTDDGLGPSSVVYFTGDGTNGVLSGSSESAVLSETFEIYVAAYIFAVTQDIENDAGLQASAIFQASTGSIIYADPILSEYQATKDSVLGHTEPTFHLNMANVVSILSWSDLDRRKRRWYSIAATLENSTGPHLVTKSSHQETVFQDGAVLVNVGAGTEFALGSAGVLRTGFPSLPVPTMSNARYVTIDTPVAWLTDRTITQREIAMIRLSDGQRTSIFTWTKATDDAKFGIAPKFRGLEMLRPEGLYAFPESPWLVDLNAPQIAALPDDERYYDAENDPDPGGTLLPDEITQIGEQQKLVAFTAPSGAVLATWLTDALREDGKLRGKGKVSKKSPAGFAAVLANAALPNPTAAQRVVVRRRMSLR